MVANIGALLLTRSGGDLPGIGASGAISGLLGAYLLLFPGARVGTLWITGSVLRAPLAVIFNWRPVFKLVLSVPAWIYILLYIDRQLDYFVPEFLGLTPPSGISYAAHLTGFASAILIFLYVRKDLLARFVRGRSL